MALLTKKRIGVIEGGRSAEREISLKSGSAILVSLKRSGYDAIPIEMDERIAERIRENNIGVAFIALHGPGGEDGRLQGLLDIVGIPYTGSGVLASGLGNNKTASKKIFIYHNIQVPPFYTLRRNETYMLHSNTKEDENNPPLPPFSKGGRGGFSGEDINLDLKTLPFPSPSALPFFQPSGLPFVVKPCCQGSSIGVSIVKKEDEFKEAIEKAFRYDEEILIERFIEGREIHVGILEDKPLGAIEIKSKVGFYNYEAKYLPGMSDHIFPAPLEKKLYGRVLEIGLMAHNAIGCEGYSRIDAIVTDNGDIFILEVNTLPGMTETSLLPEMARGMGIDFDPLVEKILSLALRRRR